MTYIGPKEMKLLGRILEGAILLNQTDGRNVRFIYDGKRREVELQVDLDYEGKALPERHAVETAGIKEETLEDMLAMIKNWVYQEREILLRNITLLVNQIEVLKEAQGHGTQEDKASKHTMQGGDNS